MTPRRHPAIAPMLLGALISLLLLGACRDRDAPDIASGTSTTIPATTAAPTVTAAPATPSGEARPAEASTSERRLQHDGRDRSYLLHIPPAYDGRTPMPLVLVFHGGGGNARNGLRQTHFDEVADRNAFIAVFPNGSGRLGRLLLTFNSGNCCGYALEQGVDDVGFTRALIEELSSTLAVDRRRVYVTGLSNGAMMSYRLACEAADLIAAAGPVAGALNVPDCAPAAPVSLIAFHGTADRAVLYEGGLPPVRPDRRERIDASVEASVGFFVSANDCDGEPTVVQSGSIVHESWPGCASGGAVGTAVELYTVEGGGHAWPGGVGGFAGADVPTDEIDASEVMWAFFAAHPKP